MTDVTTAQVTPALANALRGRYSVGILRPTVDPATRAAVLAKYPALDREGRIVVLTGKRGAMYGSVQNVHTGHHLFIDRPVEHFALVVLEDGRVGLASETR